MGTLEQLPALVEIMGGESSLQETCLTPGKV